MDIGAGIKVVRDALSPDECRDLLSETTQKSWKHSTVGSVRDFSVIEYSDHKARVSESVNSNEVRNLIDETLAKVAKPALKSFGEQWGLNLSRIGSPQFTRYRTGGFIKDHTDSGDAFPNRLGSAVVYLNDDYEGGEIEFPHIGLTYKPEAGSMLLFPCDYVHRVLPLKNGEKNIFLFFMERDE